MALQATNCIHVSTNIYKILSKNKPISMSPFSCPTEKKSIHVNHMSRDMTKPTQWLCAQRRLRSAWASAQSDQSSLSAWEKLGCLVTHWAHKRSLWSDWVDDQADLSLRWAHSHVVGFVMSRLNYLYEKCLQTVIGLSNLDVCIYDNTRDISTLEGFFFFTVENLVKSAFD